MALADVVHEAQEPASGFLDGRPSQGQGAERADDIPTDHIHHEVYLNLCYQGTDHLLMILHPEDVRVRRVQVTVRATRNTPASGELLHGRDQANPKWPSAST